MRETPPPDWWTDDAAFLAFSADWPCRPRLAAYAARFGVSPRRLALQLVATGLARLEVPPRREQDRAQRSPRARCGL